MNDHLQYAIVLTFPREIEKELQELRIKYNKTLTQIVPHITLKQPFQLLVDESIIRKKLHEITENITPFTIEFHGLSYFENEKNTAYIALKDKTQVTELHKRIVYTLQGKVDEINKEPYELENFIPHATIGENIPSEDIKRIKQELSSYNPSYVISIDSFSLYSANDNLQWKPVERFELK
jgi:2'-5' RNA ligase